MSEFLLLRVWAIIGGRVEDFLKRNHLGLPIILGTSREKTENPDWAKRFEVIRRNIRDQVSIEKVLSNDIHIVVHLAVLNESYPLNNIKFVRETNTFRKAITVISFKRKQSSKFVYFPTFHVCKGFQ